MNILYVTLKEPRGMGIVTLHMGDGYTFFNEGGFDIFGINLSKIALATKVTSMPFPRLEVYYELEICMHQEMNLLSVIITSIDSDNHPAYHCFAEREISTIIQTQR